MTHSHTRTMLQCCTAPMQGCHAAACAARVQQPAADSYSPPYVHALIAHHVHVYMHPTIYAVTQGFMHMLLQDRTKYFRYMSFSNNLWMQLPASKRPNLRFVFMCCGLLSHVYGATDARARLILASLGEVTEAPAGESDPAAPTTILYTFQGLV
jgi:hypothetical protein